VQVSEDARALELQLQLARFLRANGKADEPMKVYRAILDKDKLQPNGVRARVELDGMQLAARQRDEAQKLVDEVRLLVDQVCAGQRADDGWRNMLVVNTSLAQGNTA